MKTLKLLSAIGIISMVLYGCKGDTGPAGATGPEGINGVANISSYIFSVAPSSWHLASGIYYAPISDTAISNPDGDGIEVFCNPNNNGSWLGLPLENCITNGDDMLFTYSYEEIQFGYIYTSAPSITLYYKVVVIPPSIMKKYPNTNWHDYAQVNAIMETQAMLKK